MQEATDLITDSTFRKQARAFAKWYGLERRAILELGKIAAGWLEHYSRKRNAERLADALYQVTGLRITGRSIMYYRNIYRLDLSWRESPGRHRAKSRNHFQIRHVAPGHLRVVATARLPESKKHDVLDEIETRSLTVKQATARVRYAELEHNRSLRRVRRQRTDPQVIRGDAIEVVERLEPGSIHHLFADWQWENVGVWKESFKAKPVHRPGNPAEHLCQLLRVARPYMSQECIVWIFSKSTSFEGGEIGLPWIIQQAAHEIGLRYASEYISVHSIAGRRSANTFLAVKHQPIHPFVPEGFDFSPVEFAPSVSPPRTSPNHVSQLRAGEEKHPYQKPVALFEDLLAMGTPGGLVFDAFAGSGAAGVAAIRCGDPYLGAEMVAHYARSSNRVIANALAEHRASSKSA